MTILPGGHTVVALSGEIDIVTVPAVRKTLVKATRRAVTGVIIDLAEVTFMDAAGLGVLAGASGRARHLPSGLRLVAVPPRVVWLLEVIGLDRHLAIFPAPPRYEQPAGAEPRSQPPPDHSPEPSGTETLHCDTQDAEPLQACVRGPGSARNTGGHAPGRIFLPCQERITSQYPAYARSLAPGET